MCSVLLPDICARRPYKYDKSQLQYWVEYEWSGSMLERQSEEDRQQSFGTAQSLHVDTQFDDGDGDGKLETVGTEACTSTLRDS